VVAIRDASAGDETTRFRPVRYARLEVLYGRKFSQKAEESCKPRVLPSRLLRSRIGYHEIRLTLTKREANDHNRLHITGGRTWIFARLCSVNHYREWFIRT
jgi:hypothetical protein